MTSNETMEKVCDRSKNVERRKQQQNKNNTTLLLASTKDINHEHPTKWATAHSGHAPTRRLP